MTNKTGKQPADQPILDEDKFKVEKETFNLVLGKLLNAKPFPKAVAQRPTK